MDFGLNEACAAGTGSFLEEQAQQLGVSIKDEFAATALASKHPLKLGERCTVFMEKELFPYLHRGIPLEDITAGLAYAVVQNYLNRVVKKRRIGEVIFFQGGTAFNDAVAGAFATVLGKEIVIPPHNGIMGAIGAALLARDKMSNGADSAFRGWSLDHVAWDLKEFMCKGCSNACLVQEFTVEGEKSYWGDKCSDRYRQRTKSSRRPVGSDLIRMREEALGMEYAEEDNTPTTLECRGTVGIPRSLVFYDRLPFWRAYFESLRFQPLLSRSSRRDVIDAGVESSVAEPCFPVQVAHGHLLDLMRMEVDYVFLPHIENEEDPSESVASFICPWTQTLPLVTKHTPALEGVRDRLLVMNLQFRLGKAFIEKALFRSMRSLGVKVEENHRAVKAAYQAQSRFRARIFEAGQEALKVILENEKDSIVLLGRPYNLYDPGLNLNLPTKLRVLYGVDVLPMDFLPLDNVDIRGFHDHMFWNYGRKILQAARFCRDYSNLHVLYLSNFKCGPDSYIRHYVEGAAGEPFLFLQLDSHANDAGVMTRIEAFLESKGMV